MSVVSRMEFHHVGCLVEDISLAVEEHVKQLGYVVASPVVHVVSQKVLTCLVELPAAFRVELVQPLGDSSLVRQLRRGTNFYHVGYLVDDVAVSAEALADAGWIRMDPFASEMFCGRTCMFLMSPQLRMLELIQRSTGLELPGEASSSVVRGGDRCP